MVLGPLNTIKEVAEICFDRNVMLVRSQLLVEELVVGRVLLQHNRVTSKQVRKTIRRDRSINVQLVFILAQSHNSSVSLHMAA